MRLRNIPGADDAILNSEYCIKNPEEQKGTGRIALRQHSRFISRSAWEKAVLLWTWLPCTQILTTSVSSVTPAYFYVLYRKWSRIRFLIFKFICMDAADVAEVFAKDEVDRIYLNFSDPWPKDRHAKRRLTSRQFFARYDLILKKEGHLEFKTDNQDLFTFSLEEVPEAGWKLDASTRDLHHDAVLNEAMS